MSSLPCGLPAVDSQGPCWMPEMSLEPPPVKMLSLVLLITSVTEAWSAELPPFPKRTLLQSSAGPTGGAALNAVASPSSSNRPLGIGSPLPTVPGGGPKIFTGITALTMMETLEPAARVALLAVRKSPELSEAESNPSNEEIVQGNAGSGSWSVTTMPLAAPAPVFETVMVKEAVSPGWMTALVPSPVTVLLIARTGISVTLVDAEALGLLLKLPRFCASVKTTVAELVSVLGSPAWRARVSVKLNDAPGAMLATVAVLVPAAAWMASASRLPSRVSVNESLGLLVSRTRLGLSAELV